MSVHKPFGSSNQNQSQLIDSDEHVDLMEMQSEINANFNDDSMSELKSIVDVNEMPQVLQQSQDDI